MQSPSAQPSKPLQTLPQPPQLFLSLLKFTHLPLQTDKPALHLMPHMLLMQVAVPPPLVGPGQALPHCPQLARSFFESTQPAPHGMKPALHWYEQSPPLQRGAALAGAEHTSAHAPQFEVSVLTSTHEPVHAVSMPQSVVHLPD
jgi:hypothetical protein